MPAHADVAFLFTLLTEKDREFKWTQAPFKDLKTTLIVTPIMAYHDLSPNATSFTLDINASSHEISKGHVISYGNRTLDKAERNYNTMNSLLAIPLSAASAIAKELHTERGLADQSKTEKPARQIFWWTDIKRDVIKSYNICASIKRLT